MTNKSKISELMFKEVKFSSNLDSCLLLEDGTVYLGKAIGKRNNKSFGEIVFNTGMTGYQEILTDPSYAEQIVTLTYTEIGNYGINIKNSQSRNIFANGLVIKNLSPIVSSWQAEDNLNLDEYLKSFDKSGIYGLDTRALTRKIRTKGAMRSVLVTDISEKTSEYLESLLNEVCNSPSMQGMNLATKVSIQEEYKLETKQSEILGTVAVLDFGLKQNMLDLLLERGVNVHVFPSNTSFEKIKKINPVGIFLSNGPGDPASCTQEIETVKKLVEWNSIPIFGVCLGHQILSLVSGLKTYKLKFGHRGSNQPVLDQETKKVLITSQNHGFAVAEDNLPANIKITHRSLNDHTVEGIAYTDRPFFSVQYHPEACPGPHDTQYLFDKFIYLIKNNSVVSIK